MLDLLTRRGRIRRQYRDLVGQFDRLLALAGDPEDVTKRAAKVSAWSVGFSPRPKRGPGHPGAPPEAW